MRTAARRLALTMACGSLLCAPCVFGQSGRGDAALYPAKPIRIISGSIQGGGTDIVARMAAQGVTDKWSRPAVVDNRPGAAGALAMELTRQAAPDGYTVLVTAASLMSTATLLKRVNFDVRTEFQPVVQLTSQPYLMVVHPSLPVKSVKELIAYAQSRPGALNYASTGAGSASHFGMEFFNSLNGLKMVHVPFKAAGPALIEMLGGRDEMVFLSSIISATPHVRSGKLRALAVSSARRSPAYPELPTITEAGVRGFELNNWYGCFAPRGTPRRIVLALNSVMHAAINAPEMKVRLDAEGAEPAPAMSPEEFHKVFADEVARWEKFIKSSGFKS